MRIVVDMQGAQTTGSRNRGIGRYTAALSKEMVRLRGEHEVIMTLNGLFPDTIEPIRADFAELLPKENICAWEAVGPVNIADESNDARRRAAEISREAFLASFQPDIVLNTSLFEGLGDDAIVSIGSFTTQLPTAVIFYDLIPLIYQSIYLDNPVSKRWYLKKLDHLRRADMLLSISASSGREAVEHLGFPEEKVVNVSTACNSHFQPNTVGDSVRMYFQKTYGLNRPFVMYTGGIDHRKNIEGLIRAYAKLPEAVRCEHQLAVVCSMQPHDRQRLEYLAKTSGLKKHELALTGFVPEENLIDLYNLCKVFVFPSWHEGFGLPALEAMACGRAVIGSNTSSIPEVIGRADALFDPFDDEAIARKIEEVLTNDAYRAELERHGLTQAKKFSWEQTARRAWQALEAFVASRPRASSALSVTVRRPRLAYVSPLPPEQSGIADYSAELLPELARHYEIEVVVVQNEVSDPWVRANCPIRDVNWFRSNARRFDRVLYHFGNSVFHSHMFDLLGEFPGIVVLHDFFLSGIIAHMDVHGQTPGGWARALVHAHGWPALQARYQTKDIDDVISAYPCNLNILQQAQGVIVHSEYSRQLARKWYGPNVAEDWAVIPHLRVPAIMTDHHAARRALGLEENDFIVCSFGILNPAKLNHRLLAAWLASPLANDPHCRLVFVGQNDRGDYGIELVRSIRRSSAASRIIITGWADAATYQTWLAAADIGVQLRTLTRGETSGAVLDCMNHGLATVVNAHGSMADCPADAVWKLPDKYSDEQLIEALTTLWRDAGQRHALSRRAQEVTHTHHQPSHCAEQYAEAIENYYQKAALGLPALVDAIANVEPSLPADDLARISSVLDDNFPPHPRRKQLFLDISELVHQDLKSGIQRVVRALLRELLLNPPAGWAVEPVYAKCAASGYRYARRFTSRFLGVYDGWADDEPVDARKGDIFLGLDLQHHVVITHKDFLASLRRDGVRVYFVVYDLLPVLMPSVFISHANLAHKVWLETLMGFDGAVCISRAVADELAAWYRNHGPERLRPFKIAWFHLGADVENSVPTRGLPDDFNDVLKELSRRPTFLMVGTIEPRKGHAQVMDAFELLWKEGVDANLVIVGKQGWMVEALVKRLRKHPERNKCLFWLDGISDEYLENIYAASTCLIAASEGEGFGLPLIEAARHKLPIIARDIPVFREVAGDHAYYFDDKRTPEVLATALKDWLPLYRAGTHPGSQTMPWQTWKASSQQLLATIMGPEP
jgi:glycosyltransferase involved in cell wall biosynthesis